MITAGIGCILTYTHPRPCEGHPYSPFNIFEIVMDDVCDHFDATIKGRGNPLLSFGGQIVSDSYTPQMQINMRNSYSKKSVNLVVKVINGNYGIEMKIIHKGL